MGDKSSMGCGTSVQSNTLPPASEEKIKRTIEEINRVVAAAMKEALSLAIDHACATAGQPGGYSKNPKIAIQLPDIIAQMREKLKTPLGAPFESEFESFQQ